MRELLICSALVLLLVVVAPRFLLVSRFLLASNSLLVKGYTVSNPVAVD